MIIQLISLQWKQQRCLKTTSDHWSHHKFNVLNHRHLCSHFSVILPFSVIISDMLHSFGKIQTKNISKYGVPRVK